MSCASPLDLQTLADYWAGELDAAAEERVEEHLLGCSECSALLEWLASAVDGVKQLVRGGVPRQVLSPDFVEQLKASGLRAREYAPPAGGEVQCTIAPDDDLLIAHLRADLEAAKQLDIVICGEDGTEFMRMPDVPFAPSSGEVIFNEPAPSAKQMPTNVLRVKLVEPGDAGDRLVAEYTFDHSRWDDSPANPNRVSH